MKINTDLSLNTIITFTVIGGVAYAAYQLLGSAKGNSTLNTLGQGLSNPLDALGALFKSDAQLQAENAGTGGIDQNFQDYIDRVGGTDNYIAAHKAGTYKAAPYDKTKSYKPTPKATSYKLPIIETTGAASAIYNYQANAVNWLQDVWKSF